MPKIGLEPQRRQALIGATIATIAEHGSLDVTVAQIAKRAGVSPALAHHYFGSKDALFLATMRAILAQLAIELRSRLHPKLSPRDRLLCVIDACFAPSNFSPATAAAWLNLYVFAAAKPDAARLLQVYHARLASNLMAALRPMMAARAHGVCQDIAALIDGYYLRAVLEPSDAAKIERTAYRARVATLRLAGIATQ